MPEGAILPPVDEYLAELRHLTERVSTLERAAPLTPPIPIPFSITTQGTLGIYGLYASTTSAAWVGAYAYVARQIPNLGIQLDIPLTVDAGTSGEMRVRNGWNVGNSPTATFSFSAALTPNVRWLHGAPVWSAWGWYVVEIRRTAGAGNVYCYEPWASFTRPDGCTPTGT